MTNDLISVPSYNLNTLKYCHKIIVHQMEKGKKEYDKPIEISPTSGIYPEYARTNKPIWNKCGKEFIKFFLQFEYRPGVHHDKLDDTTWLIQKFRQVGAKVDRFCSEKEAEFRPKYIPARLTMLYYVAYYTEIREELLPYLEQWQPEDPKFAKERYLKKLRLHFQSIQENSTDFDTYLEDKAKYMAGLDLDDWLEGIKKK